VSAEQQALPAFGITLLYPNPGAPSRRKRRQAHEEHVVDGLHMTDEVDATYVPAAPKDER
jgi:hypothetical protein